MSQDSLSQEKAKPKRLLQRVTIIIALALPVLFIGTFCFNFSIATKRTATNGDWVLTWKARSAKPIIAALNQYKAQHGHYPPNALQLKPFLPNSNISATGLMNDDWQYHQWSGPNTYTLWLKLGWDPSLSYSVDGSTSVWTFDPGDGTPSTQIKLSP